MLRPTRTTPAVAIAALLLTTFTLAACGGSSQSGRDTASSADIAGARAEVDRYRKLPRFTPPGHAFDASSRLRGKKIFEIPITSEIPFVTSVEKGMRQAATLVGANLVVYRNQGKPTQWAQGISTAIAQNSDAITLLAQDPELVRPQIAKAEKAGIPVLVLRTTGEGEPCQRSAGGDSLGTTCVPGPFELAGRLEADWVVARSKGNADVLVVTSNDARSTAPLVRGLRDVFKTRCPGCDTRFVDVPIPDWASKIRTEVQSALVRDPSIDYVIPIYDSMSQYAVPAIKAAGRAGSVRIAAFNGTPFVLGMLAHEDVVEMDAGENLSWIGWASMDATFRAVVGERPVRSEHTPVRVFDDGNVAQAGDPPRFDTGYGSEYVQGYRRLWGLSR